MTGTSIRPVTVGVDGSESALAAVRWAADEAVWREAPLRIVHANLWPIYRPPAGHYPIQHQQPLLEHSRRLLFAALVAATERHPDLTISGDLIPTTAVDLILAESRTAQLVVLGSRGHGSFAGVLLGSVTATVTAHGRCPVVVLRGYASVPAEPAIGPVVIGLDGSRHDDPALRFAFDAAKRRDTDLVALHAYGDGEPEHVAFAGWDDLAVENEHRQLVERLTTWRAEFPDVKVTSLVVPGRPAHALLRAAHGARLLVIGSRRRGGLAGMLPGSTNRALLHHGGCPLAVVRGHGAESKVRTKVDRERDRHSTGRPG